MNQKDHHVYEFGPFRLDLTEGVLFRGDETVRLTPKAFKLLLVLVQNSGHILNKDDLMNEVWPNVVVEETNLAGNVYALRQALGDGKDEDRYIETIPKRGYRFVARVREVLYESTHPVAELSTSPKVAEEELSKSEGTQMLVAANLTGEAVRGAKRRPFPKILVVCVTLAGLTVVAVYYWVSSRTRPSEHNVTIRSIAVLPLKNLSGDPEQEYFADGMTEAMINELAKIGALRVISRTSVMQYKETRKTAPEIARELNVDAIVEGSVLRSNDRVRITAQLICATTDEHLWAENYERNLSDVLGLQGDIARGIAQEIRIKLTPRELARLARTRPINPSAHEAYLKGLYYLNQAINTSSLAEAEQPHRKSFEYFEQAISLEPNHAQAYAGLARSYHWLASAGKPEFFPTAKEAALKAIAIDDTLAEAHAALAYTIWNYEWDWAGAEKEYKRTKELNSSSMGEHGYALLLSAMGRHDDAIREMRLALDLEPLILQARVNLGWIYLNGRQYDQAIEQFQGTLELNPDYAEAYTGLGTVYSGKGEYEKAIAEFQKAAALSRNMPAEKADLGWAYAKAGKRSEAIRILDELKRSSTQEKPVKSTRSAVIYAALGEKDQAVMLLEKACAERERPLIWLKVALKFDDVRSHPRFIELLRCVGIPQ